MPDFTFMERDEAREVQVVFRTSKARREQIRQQAKDAGVSLQVYLEATVLGRAFDDERVGGRPRKSAQTAQELPLTG